MALTTTTLSSAVATTDTTIVVASATGLSASMLLLIDQEWMQVPQTYVAGNTTITQVRRGLQGSAVAAHVASANVTFGVASDFASPAPQTSVSGPIAGRARTLTSYSASGAVTLPTPGTDAVAVLNGTSALAMTIAAPTKDMDGCLLYFLGNAKSQSTLTFANGLGNAGGSYDVLTAQNAGNLGLAVMACNGFWNLVGAPITGTSTALSWAVS